MRVNFRSSHCGYTVVEMMVTIVMVTILAVTFGTFIVKLLNIQEREREEAYVREKLVDICGAYADMLSIGSSVINTSDDAAVVKYRLEVGGVSMETGIVQRVAYVAASMNPVTSTLDTKVYGIEPGEVDLDKKLLARLVRRANGDAALLPLVGDMISCTLTPLGISGAQSVSSDAIGNDDAVYCAKMIPYSTFWTDDTALYRLVIAARYKCKKNDGTTVAKNLSVERVVRLWNRE